MEILFLVRPGKSPVFNVIENAQGLIAQMVYCGLCIYNKLVDLREEIQKFGRLPQLSI